MKPFDIQPNEPECPECEMPLCDHCGVCHVCEEAQMRAEWEFSGLLDELYEI